MATKLEVLSKKTRQLVEIYEGEAVETMKSLEIRMKFTKKFEVKKLTIKKARG